MIICVLVTGNLIYCVKNVPFFKLKIEMMCNHYLEKTAYGLVLLSRKGWSQPCENKI